MDDMACALPGGLDMHGPRAPAVINREICAHGTPVKAEAGAPRARIHAR